LNSKNQLIFFAEDKFKTLLALKGQSKEYEFPLTKRLAIEGLKLVARNRQILLFLQKKESLQQISKLIQYV